MTELKEWKYILDEHNNPVQCHSISEWAEWFETHDRTVKRDNLPDECLVSTVFLAQDHNFGHGVPLLFETMVFGGNHNDYMRRYETIEEALEGHEEVLRILRAQ